MFLNRKATEMNTLRNLKSRLTCKRLRYFGNLEQRHYANPNNYRYGIDVANQVWTFIRYFEDGDIWMVLSGTVHPSPYHQTYNLSTLRVDRLHDDNLGYVNSDGRADVLYKAKVETHKFLDNSGKVSWTVSGHLPCWIGRTPNIEGVATAFAMSAKAMGIICNNTDGYIWQFKQAAIEADARDRKFVRNLAEHKGEELQHVQV